MNSQRIRPIGITLLAIAFLWIGGVGSLVFPIMLLTGAIFDVLDLSLGHVIHSPGFLHAAEFLLAAFLLGAYVLYALIGYGLWKLRRWAWTAVVVVHWICIIGGVLGGLITLVWSGGIGIAVIGILAPYGGILWYLYRPRVRAAFEPPHTDRASDPLPPPTGKRAIITVVGVCALGLAVFGGALFFGVGDMMRSSGAVQAALEVAQRSPCVTNRLGTPIAVGRTINGEISESADGGSADLGIPVRGPKGKATLQVAGTKKNGAWKFQTFSFIDGSANINLLAQPHVCP